MKKFTIALASAAALLAGPALAADLAVRPIAKAPAYVPAPIASTWTGFYIGINGGGVSTHKCWDYLGTVAAPLPAASEGCHDGSGGTFGGQIGYNWQMANWVFGVEAQGNWANVTGTNVSLLFPAFTNRTRLDSFGLFTGKVGMAFNNVMLYVKGGAAVVSDRYDYYPTVLGPNPPTGTASETRWGGTVGGGLEFAFSSNWSVGVEYNHIFLGDRTITFASPAATVDRIRQDVDIFTGRVNFRFGGPVVASY